jgi:hypothetical protein
MARQQTLEYSCHPLAVPVFTNSKQIIVDTVDTLCRYLGPQKVVCQRLCDEDEGHNTNPTPLLMWDSVSLLASPCIKSISRFVCVKSPAWMR